MKRKTIEAISELLEEELGPSYWGEITLRIQRGKVVNIRKQESIKVENLDRESG